MDFRRLCGYNGHAVPIGYQGLATAGGYVEGVITVNGIVKPAAEAQISALDRGFLFGESIFEGLVAFDQKILDLPRHLSRLRASARELALTIPWSDEELTFELTTAVSQVSAPKKQVRLVLTRGEGLGLSIPEGVVPNRLVYVTPARIEDDAIYEDGIAVKRRVLPSTERGPAPKVGNYLRSIMALRGAQEEGFQDILWTNSKGEITEGSASNVFLIARQGDEVEIVTPPAHSGILLGITRETLIRLLRQSKIAVHEQVVFADELARFDEAFLCSTVRGLVPIQKVDQHRLYTMRKQSVFRHISRLFLTWVQTEIGYRVDWNRGHPVPS